MKHYKQTTKDNQVSYIASDTKPSDSPSGYFTIETITKTEYDKDKLKPTPEELKAKAIYEKDMESAIMLTSGYEIEPGKVMSTSLPAQTKWNSLMNVINAGFPPLVNTDKPYPVSLVDGDVYFIDNLEDLIQLYINAFVEKNEEYIEKLKERKVIKDS